MDLDGRRVYLRLLRYAVPYRRVFAAAILSMVVLAATEPAIPMLLKPTLDGSFVDRDLNAVALMSVLLVVVFFVRGLSSFMSAVTLASVASNVVKDLRIEMFDKLISLSAAFHDQHTSGGLISRVTYDAAQVTEATTEVVTILVRDSLAVSGLVAWMLYLNWKLTVIGLVVSPVIMVTVKYFSRRLRRVSNSLQETMGSVTHVLQESIDGHKVVRSFGGQDYEQQRFNHGANRVRQLEVKFAASAAAAAPVTQVVTAVGLATMIYLASVQVHDGSLTVGTFVSFFAAMGLMFAPLKRLTSANSKLQRGIAAAHRMFTLIDEQSEPDTGARELERAEGRIDFEKVSFVYGDKNLPALRNVSLTVKPGQTIGLVGASGSGKTTLVSLILRFYPPDSGRILLDHVPIDELKLRALRDQIALVSQDIVLFNGTVAENIAYGPLASRSREEVIQAAKAASALEFISELPQGLDTQVGANGVRLSGGQRQRLAIARAFLKDAPILVLDEATSALDTEFERYIQAALKKLKQGRTTIIIAHRLSTLQSADCIFVLEDGEIREIGNHDDLLARNGIYTRLYQLQAMPATSWAQPVVATPR